MSIENYISKKIEDKRFVLLLLSFFTVFLYGNSIFNAYNLDDELVTLNHRLTSKGISAIPEIFKSPYYEDNMGYSYEYRPMVLVSFAIEHQFFNDNPKVGHLINLLLYLLTVICLYKFLRLVFLESNPILPIIATLVFAAFPLHTEVVSNIKNRDVILAVLFSLLSGIHLIRYYSSGNLVSLLFSSVLFLVSLLSKSDSIIFLVIFPLLLLFFMPNKFDRFVIIVVLFDLLALYFLPVTSLANKLLFYLAQTLSLCFFYIVLNLPDFKERMKQGYLSLFQSKEADSEIVSWWPSKPNYLRGFFLLSILIINSSSFYFGFYPKLVFLFSLVVTFLVMIRNANDELAMFFFVLNFIVLNYFLPYNVYRFEFSFFIPFLLILKYRGFTVYGITLFVLNFLVYKFKNHFGFFENNYFALNLLILYFLYALKFKLNIAKIVLSIVIFIRLTDFETWNFISENNYSVPSFLEYLFQLLPYFLILYTFFFDKVNLLRIIGIVTIVLFSVSVLFVHATSLQVDNVVVEHRTAVTNVTLSPIKETYRPVSFVEVPINENLSFSGKLANSFHVLGTYFKLMIVPYPMGFYYGYAFFVPVTFTDSFSLISLFLHLLLLIIAFILIKRQPVFSFGLFFYLIAILAFSNLFKPFPGVLADRFTYVASIGFAIIIAYVLLKGFKVITDRKASLQLPKGLVLCLTLILGLYSYLTIARNFQWKNHLTLMRHDIDYLDKSAQAHNLLALNLMKYSFEKEYQNKSQAMREEALLHFKKAVEIYPDFFNAWYDLGRVYMLFNDLDKAYPCFEKVRSMDSTFIFSTINMALIADAKGNTKLAENLYKEVIRINPGAQEAYGGLGYVYFKSGQLNESIKINEEAIKLFPQWAEPYQNIINIYLSQKDTASAQRVMNQMPR